MAGPGFSHFSLIITHGKQIEWRVRSPRDIRWEEVGAKYKMLLLLIFLYL